MESKIDVVLILHESNLPYIYINLIKLLSISTRDQRAATIYIYN